MRIELLDEEKFLDTLDSKRKWDLFKKEYIKAYFINKIKYIKNINLNYQIDSKDILYILPNNIDISKDDIFYMEIQEYFTYMANFILHNSSDIDLCKDLFLELIIVSKGDICGLNKQYMQKDYATDVLSFPLEIYDIKETQCMGSIIINIDEVYTKSITYKHNIYAELSLLFIHSLLHILGFDHEKDNGEHRKMEKNIIEQLKLPNSLIERTLND